MTREEVIKQLDTMWKMLTSAYDDIADSHVAAYTMAVDVLKAQGTCEDAVSIQTLQKELALYPIDDVTSEDEAGYNRAINDVQKMVLHLPSAQPERTEYIPNTKAIPSERDCVDLSERVTATFYDEEHEEWSQKTVTIMDVLDSVCDEYTILPSAQPNLSKDELRLIKKLRSFHNGTYAKVLDKLIASARLEIVRCKNCKHRDPEDRKCDCGHDILWQLPRQDDWYCADAERRTE